ncbi:hypothetical protein G5V59_16500 [Nocardioides sp. W3-2-3]|uniref:hypothetical protein n=1 Tax=Nocardioides convexus TaxID=2712224 RepID=UPI0024187338|nr:hypothetical protein [Nocardioides convexus]NHA00961.1 hypothetical protein [Nocardioides convexus]
MAAGFVLVKGDEGPLSECTTSTTRKLPAEQPAPSTGAPPIARPAPSVEDRALVVTEEVTKCEPTTLTGGLALLLGLAAVALILPAWVRAMPDGDLETPWVKAQQGFPSLEGGGTGEGS